MADQNNRPRLHVEFYTSPKQNMKRTREEGRPIFEDAEFVRIRFAGDRNRTLEAPANQPSVRDPQDNTRWLTYIDRFPDHYKAFKEGRVYRGGGTPLDELPFLTASQRAELRAVNIHDAETLAAMEGEPLKKLGMFGRALKDQAQAWLDKAKGSADLTRMAADNAALREQMEAMQRQLAEFIARGNAPSAPSAAPASQFAAMDDNAIKDFIKQKTGERPRGNPSHATLVSMADEIAAQQPVAA